MKKNYIQKNKKGVTLVEVLVTTFMFVIIVGAVSHLFAGAIDAKRNVSAVQSDYEKAQLALNLVAKVLRTSTVVGINENIPPTSNSVHNAISIQIFDYSQEKCLSFRFDTTAYKLQLAEDANGASEIGDCDGTASGVLGTTPSFSTYRDLADTHVEGFFDVTKTDVANNTTGKVTIALQAKPGTNNDRDVARMQTTVSLRDYEEN